MSAVRRLLLEFMLDRIVNAEICSEKFVTYTRTDSHYSRDYTKLVKGVTLDQCQNFCNKNLDDEGKPLQCKSFDYQPSTTFCYLSRQKADPFSANSLTHVGATNPDTDHYEKVCVKSDEQMCKGDYAAFSRIPQQILVGYADVVESTETVDACLERCVRARRNGDHKCVSSMYFYASGDCVLNKISRFSNPELLSREDSGKGSVAVDYFDFYCVGEWGTWSAWGNCDCDNETQTRTRHCSDFNRCLGAEQETQPCKPSNCFIARDEVIDVLPNGEWSQWTLCSITCGRGTQTRFRPCDISNSCPNGETLESRLCLLPVCEGGAFVSSSGLLLNRDLSGGAWGPWSEWGVCSVTCGSGAHYRSRTCLNENVGNCHGPLVDMKPCVLGFPCISRQSHVTTNWVAWESWSPCTVTCGEGVQTRSRACLDPIGCGPIRTLQTRKCFNKECSLNPTSFRAFDSNSGNNGIGGDWDAWEPWSPCSVSCDDGFRRRQRSCRARRCDGVSFETQPCYAGKCYDNDDQVKWGQWSDWSLCSTYCGPGERTRKRVCLQGDCDPNSGKQTGTCENRPCSESPFNSFGTQTTPQTFEISTTTQSEPNLAAIAWGEWSPWSTCSETCGKGEQQRQRPCSDSEPKMCQIGQETQVRRCLPRPPPCQGDSSAPLLSTFATTNFASVSTFAAFTSTAAKSSEIPATKADAVVTDAEANQRFLDCCLGRGQKKSCAEKTCRYDATVDVLLGSLADPSVGCSIENLGIFLECASDGNDNTACCRAAQMSKEICLKGCTGSADGVAELIGHPDALDCALESGKVLGCHRKGLKPRNTPVA